MKKMIIIILSVFIAFSPLLTIGNFSFADDSSNNDNWQQVTTKEQFVASWKAYLASRNIYQNGNPVGALVSWSYDELEEQCNFFGFTVAEAQAGLYYALNNDSGLAGKYLRFRYTTSAWNIFNQIFSRFAQQNGLNDIFDTTLKSGLYIQDDDGNGAFVYDVNTSTQTNNQGGTLTGIQTIGSAYYTKSEILQLSSNINLNSYLEITKSFKNNQISFYLCNTDYNGYYPQTKIQLNNSTNLPSNNSIGNLLGFSTQTEPFSSNIIFIRNLNNNNIYIGTIYVGNRLDYQSLPKDFSQYSQVISISSNNAINAAVSIASDGLQAAVNANGKMVAIDCAKKGLEEGYNSIKEFLEDDEPDAKPKNTDIPDDEPTTPDPPSDPTIPINPPSGLNLLPDGNGGFNFNFQMPDFSSFDWGLNFDVSDMPFPFSIPYDIIRFLNIMDSNPVAPHYEIQTTVFNTPVDIDIDLSQFDSAMVVIRNIILVGYCVFLIVSTRALFHIY